MTETHSSAHAAAHHPGFTDDHFPGPTKVGNLDVYLDAIGTVTPVYTDTIVSPVAGIQPDEFIRMNDEAMSPPTGGQDR